MTHMLCPSSDIHLMALALSIMEDLLSLFSFMGSHPLQFAYLLFFSSHLIRILSFLCPLLLTTFLLLLALLTIFPFPGEPPDDDPSRGSPAFSGNTWVLVLDALKPRLEGNDSLVAAVGPLGSIFLELEACLDSALEYCEEEKMPTEDDTNKDSSKGGGKEEEEDNEREEKEVFTQAFPSNGYLAWEEFEAIGKLYQALTHEVGEYPIKLAIRNLKKKQLLASDLGLMSKEETLLERSNSKEASLEGWETPKSEFDGLDSPTSMSGELEFAKEKASVNQKVAGLKASPTEKLERYGSVGGEREWKRTLACKLYEERWAVSGDDGDEECMDSLWEEDCDVNVGDGVRDGDVKDKSKAKEHNTSGKKEKEMKKDSKGKKKKDMKKEKNDEEEEEEADEVVGQFCCLQALRFSTGKMGFGGRIGSFMKVSKALKGGVGLFRHSGRTSKKQ